MRASKPLGNNKNHENSQPLCSFFPMLCLAITHFFLNLGSQYSAYPHYWGEKTEVQGCEGGCISSHSWEAFISSASRPPDMAEDHPEHTERMETTLSTQRE